MSIENLTDEELLRHVYSEHTDNPLVQTLAARLEQASDRNDVLNDLFQQINRAESHLEVRVLLDTHID